MLDQLSSETAVRRLAGPAMIWTDGHVLGNGDVGAVVWGGPETVYVSLSKHDVHDLRNAPHGIRWSLTYPEILRRVQQGERGFLMKLGNVATPDPHRPAMHHPVPVSCGRLSLELMRGVQTGGYEQELSLQRACCTCRPLPGMKGHMWGIKYSPVEARVIVQAQTNVVLIELTSASEHRIAWAYDRNPTPWLDEPKFIARKTPTGRVGIMQHALPVLQERTDGRTTSAGVSYAVAVSSAMDLAAAARCKLPADRVPELSAGAVFDVSACATGLRGVIEFGGAKGPGYLTISLASSFDAKRAEAKSPAILAARLAAGVTERNWGGLQQRHEAWWAEFWKKSQVRCQDRRLEGLWAMGLYALGSATRPDKSPPHLQGIWNQFDVPSWQADYHFNVNVQESHWPACSSNHPELQEALVRVLVHDWRDELRRFAREQYEAPGLAVPFCTDWRGRGIGGWPLAAECCNTAWAAQHVWWQWLHTRDLRRLRKEFFPFLRECCEFYRHILHRREDGLFHVELSHSPEQDWFNADGSRLILFGRDPAIDISMLRYLFGATVEAAEILGLRDEFVDGCRVVRDHLPPLPTYELGPDLKITAPYPFGLAYDAPAWCKGKFLIDQAVGFFEKGDAPGWVPCSHRHPSRLTPIFPCEDIGLHSDAQTLAMGRRSFEEFRGYGNSNYTGWSLAFQACIAARLGLGDDTHKILTRLLDSYGFAGGLLSHDSIRGEYGHRNNVGGVFQTEAMFGAAAAVNEMLLQHTGGVTRLFPAAIAGQWAEFHNLRAPGGILVSGKWDGRQTVEASLRTEHDVEVRLANPWPGQTILLRSGRTRPMRLGGEVLTWPASAGAEYSLRAKVSV
jgi:hypothetical protein